MWNAGASDLSATLSLCATEVAAPATLPSGSVSVISGCNGRGST
jgi:hypothetical protein